MTSIRNRFRYTPLLLFPALLLMACEGQSLEGVLNDIDCANGELTVVTDEGKTIVLTIDTPECEAQDLQPGDSVEVTTGEEGDTVQDITVVNETAVDQTTVVGKIVSVEGDRVTVEKDNGETVVVVVEPAETDVNVDDGEGSVQDLTTNVNVVIQINQETNVAQTITVNDGSSAPDTTTPEPGTPEPEASPTMDPKVAPVPGETTPEPEASPTIEASPAPTY